MSNQQVVAPAVMAPPGFFDAFISYSRVDRDDARRIAGALVERGRSLWVDWEGIPPTSEWRQEIHEAIQRSDAVIFMLSPESARSHVCGIEIDQALSDGKRIIPVVVREVHPDDVAPELAKRQWLTLGDDVAATADRIIEAMDIDLAAVKTHTRLTVRASEWEASGRDNARLLRGRELADAETWLTSLGAEVTSTQQVSTLVVQSRLAANKRQRLLVGAVSVGLVVALVLGGFAFLQRRTAVEQRDLAGSQALASASLATLASDPQTSLLLALEATKTGHTSVVDEALRRSVLASDIERVITPCDVGEAMGDMAFSGDGSSIYTTCASRGLQRFDLATGRRTLGGTGEEQAGIGSAWALTSTTTAGPVLAGAPGLGVKLMDPSSGAVSESAWTTGAPVYSLTPTRDGAQVAEAGTDGARLLDAQTGAVLKEYADWEVAGEVYSGSPDPSGRRIAFASQDGKVRIYEVDSTKLVRTLDVGSSAGFVSFSPSGKFLLTTSQDRIARVWDATTGRVVQQLGHNALINDATWTGNDGYVATADSVGVIRVWSVATGDVVSELLGHTEWVSYLAASPDGARLASASEDGTVRIWRWGAGVPEATSRMAATVTGLSVRNDGAQIVAASPGDGTVIVDARSGRRLRVLDAGAIGPPTYSPDGLSVVTIDYAEKTSRVQLVDAETGDVRWTAESFGTVTAPDYTKDPSPLVTREAGAYRSVFSPDGTRIAAVTELGVVILGAETGQVVAHYTGEPSLNSLDSYLMFAPVRGLAYVPDGSTVVAPDGQDVVMIDAATGVETARLSGHTAEVVAVAVTPDGQHLISTSVDGTARIWDVASGRVTHVLQHQGRGADVAVSASGLVATTSRDGTVQVWDLDGTLLMRTRVATLEATSVAFSAGGNSLVVGTGEGIDERVGLGSAGGLRSFGAVQLLDCPVCRSDDALVELARAHAIRELSAAEIAHAVDGTPLPGESLVALPLAVPGSGDPVSPDLVGTFRARIDTRALPPEYAGLAGDVLIRLQPSGAVLIYNFSAGPDHGQAEEAGSTLTMRTDSCGDDVGRYGWRRTGQQLTLVALSDACDFRRLALISAPFVAAP